MHWSEWHMNGMGGMWLWWTVILIAVVAVVVFAMSGGRRGGGSSGPSPVQVLKRRYANGEIDRDTYERMLEDLRK